MIGEIFISEIILYYQHTDETKRILHDGRHAKDCDQTR